MRFFSQVLCYCSGKETLQRRKLRRERQDLRMSLFLEGHGGKLQPVCSMTDPPRWREVAPGQSPQREGERPLDALGGRDEARPGVEITKLHACLQSWDARNTRKENPWDSQPLYRVIWQIFKGNYGLLSKEWAHLLRNTNKFRYSFERNGGTNIFFEAPTTEKRTNEWKLL